MDASRQEQLFREELERTSLQFEEKIRESMAIRRIGESLKYARDVRKVFGTILGLLLDETEAENCSLLLYDGERGELYLKAARGREDADFRYYPAAGSSPLRFRRGVGVAGWVAQEGKAAFLSDVSKDDRFVPVPGARTPVGTLLCLPLVLDGETAGVVNLSHPEPGAFREADRLLAVSVADHVAAALEGIQAFDELQQFNAALEAEVERATEALRRTNEELQSEIAERQRIEANLRAQEQKLEALNATLEERVRQRTFELQGLVDNLPAGVCLLDEEWRLIVANPVAQSYLELMGEIGPDGKIVRIGGQEAEGYAANQDGPAHEVVLEDPVSRIFEVEANPVAQRRSGEGWVLVLREVTREREVQERLQQQDRLAVVGQLAAGIAHDFNNLLTVILASAEIMGMDQSLPQSASGYLEMISSQGQRAARLVRQILDFSRKSIVRPEPVSLQNFLTETAAMLMRILSENIQIVTECDVQNDTVEADTTQMQQVLTNLAVNAQDAMPEGGIFRMALSDLPDGQDASPVPGLEDGDWLVLSVSDTGTGMTPEALSHMFEPFFTTKGPGRGTGLGLAQVYGIVKQHRGEITVESVLEKGTTFRIYLPRVADEPVQQEDGKARILKGRGEALLVVEDQAEVLRLVRSMLEELNYRVFTAGNGREALDVYAKHSQDIALVVTDLVMPEMGGKKLIEVLKAEDPHLRVVVITGYPLGEDHAQIPDGVAGWVEKPIALDRLSQTVHVALRGRWR